MTTQSPELRQLGSSDIYASAVALGCWPIAGMTSLDVNEADSVRTLEAALAQGVNFFDTAYAYGMDGESERLIAQVLRHVRDQVVLATKCGLGWEPRGQRVIDGCPKTLKMHVAQSLLRLGVDHVDLLYLHAPDPDTALSDSAGALAEMMSEGKTRLVGVSNLSLSQIELFHSICPISVVQPPYNMLQRQIETDILPWCRANNVSVAVYWPLMKGLLTGKLPRDYQFPVNDGRAKYPMFQGVEWQRNQDFVDDLRDIARDCDRTIAEVVVRWTLQQPGITAAICGAKRAHQIEETARAMRFSLDEEQLSKIERALAHRGTPSVRSAV